MDPPALVVGMVCPLDGFFVGYVCRGVGLSGLGLSWVEIVLGGFVGVSMKQYWLLEDQLETRSLFLSFIILCRILLYWQDME